LIFYSKFDRLVLLKKFIIIVHFYCDIVYHIIYFKYDFEFLFFSKKKDVPVKLNTKNQTNYNLERRVYKIIQI
jgi:hypothetical protein